MLAQAALVGRTLAERGHRVVFARCYRLFERCPVMDMHQLPYEATSEQKLESCLRCADNSLSMLGEYGLPTVDLRSLVTSAMRQQIDRAIAGRAAGLNDIRVRRHPIRSAQPDGCRAGAQDLRFR